MITDERVERALKNLLDRGEVGIRVAAYQGEKLIIDTWIGDKNLSGDPVDEDTLFPIFSTSKGLLSGLVLIRADKGYFSIDDPIAKYWPEYGCNGKENITPRHVLAHKAGVPQMPPYVVTDEDLANWDYIIKGIEQMVPMNAPMARAQYHGVSKYYIMGELLRRTDPQRRMFDEIFREEISIPLGIDNDLWWRMPPEQDHRVAELTYGDAPPKWPVAADKAAQYAILCPPAHTPTPANHNRPAIRRMIQGQIYTNAQAGAKFWSIFANKGTVGGVRFLSEKMVEACGVPSENPDLVDEFSGHTPRYSLGFRLSTPTSDMAPVVGPGSRTIAVYGGGGTLGWADLDSGLSAMYTHNRMGKKKIFAELGDAIRAVAADYR